MTKFNRAIDAILALFLIIVIFGIGVMTVYPNVKELYDSARLLKRLEPYLPEKYNQLDLLSARIMSFEDEFNANLWKSTELGYLNSSFQYALGKNMITTGNSHMVTLKTGDLYDLQSYKDVSAQLDEIARLNGELSVPMLFLYEHPTTYGDNALTGGYAMLDKGDEMSDEIVGTLRSKGVNVIDSRDMLKGQPVSEIVLRTDQHWTSYAALLAARKIADELGLNSSNLDTAKFSSSVYKNKFMGKYGQRVGTGNVKPDDITVWYPNYDTHILRVTMNNGKTTSAEGSFKDAAIKWNFLEGEGWNIEAYKCYGLTENWEKFHNEAGQDVSILLLKDSYSAPIGAFLSLICKDVYTVDMRKTDLTAMDYVRQTSADYVIVGYSRQMLINSEYNLE